MAGSPPGTAHQAYRASVRADVDAPVVRTVDDRSYRGPKLGLSTSYVGRNAVEPTLGVARDGVAYFAAGTFDAAVAGLARTEVLRSDDGGRTWKSVQRKVSGNVSVPPTTLDPYVWVDPDTDRVFSVDLYAGCSFLSFSDDRGKTWTDNPLACGVPVNDHQTFVTGKPREGDRTIDYPNVAYYCVNQIADVSCARSLDGGMTFLPSGAPAFSGLDPAAGGLCGGLHGHIVVDTSGRLYLPKGHCGKPWLAVSEDGGVSWKQYRVSDIGAAGPHTAVTTDDAGNVYYVWWDNEDQLPYLAVSRDNGKTWGPPLMVAPPGVRSVNFPSVDATGTGRLVITYPGTRLDDTVSDRPWNYYVTQTMNALERRPLFVSATANRVTDPIHRGACNGRCAGMFDFLDVVFAPNGAIWAAAVDTCTGQCVNAAGAANDAKGAVVVQTAGPGVPRGPRR